MSRYYKAKDVIMFLNMKCPKDMWEYQIADLPTIDIVRCKECKFSKVYQIDSGEEAVRVCKAYKHIRLVSDDDFCSYGERINNEQFTAT